VGLKRFLPIENYTLTSRLSAQEIHDKVYAIIPNKQRGVASAHSYSGTVGNHSFKISREINYRNSFLPVIEGKITESAGHTQIAVRMRLPLPVLIFLCVWMGLLSIPCLLIGLAGFLYVTRHGFRPFEPMLLIPFGMLLFGWALAFFAFKAESMKSKNFLEKLLTGMD
jgi:hypothetical protein